MIEPFPRPHVGQAFSLPPAVGSDCDDEDLGRSPEILETACDGIDRDCSGTDLFVISEGAGARPDWTDADAWHGSDAVGNPYSGQTCNDWTSSSSSVYGTGTELDACQVTRLETGHPCSYYREDGRQVEPWSRGTSCSESGLTCAEDPCRSRALDGALFGHGFSRKPLADRVDICQYEHSTTPGYFLC